MTAKPKVAITWLGACGGCDEAIVDLNEALLDVAAAIEIVFWPVALDFKYDNVRAFKDSEIALSIITGCVRNSEHAEVAELLRRKSGIVLAFGACACFGGTSGLANFISKKEIFDYVYKDAPTVVNPNGVFPQTVTELDGKTLTLPEFYEHVYALNQVIPVDYYLPGCPPPPDLIATAVKAVLTGDLPPRGSTLAPRRALCDTCPRNKKKPLRLEITKINRIHQIESDPDFCFLEQGILCMGSATRGGCGETCVRNNIPCRGCFGPVPGVEDAGGRYLSAIASILKTPETEDLRDLTATVMDPAGTFYRFGQAVSILGREKLAKP
ncbi:MAG: oxidoreductase [Thermodesulfobacteriota bacterium]